MSPVDYWRQLDIVPMDRLGRTHVDLIGAGGIGSPAALALAKMGVGELNVWDDDSVEVHNFPNQLHLLSALGQNKATVLANLLRDFTDEVEIGALDQRVNGSDSQLQGIVVAAVDSMTSRKAVWEVCKQSFSVDLFIDARMGGLLLRLYTVDPHDPSEARRYEATLHSDEEGLQLPCTAQSIIYTGMMAGSLIANAVKRYVSRESPTFEVVFDLTELTLLKS